MVFQYCSEITPRCRGNWGCDDSMHGHVERKGDADYVGASTNLMVEGTALVGRPRKNWQNTVCRHASAES